MKCIICGERLTTADEYLFTRNIYLVPTCNVCLLGICPKEKDISMRIKKINQETVNILGLDPEALRLL